MILVTFPNNESKRAALVQLAGRFSFKSWATGEMLVPEDALAYLAVQGLPNSPLADFRDVRLRSLVKEAFGAEDGSSAGSAYNRHVMSWQRMRNAIGGWRDALPDH